MTTSPRPLRGAAPVLRVHAVSKRYAETVALDGVDLELYAGEHLALLGPNGAGKTTLVRCIAGRAVPQSGTVAMFDRPLPAAGPRDGLGFVPQSLAVYPDLTARENLEVFARFLGLRQPRLGDAVNWALDWTGLADRAGQLVKTFSGGMMRRVNIACGVLHRPQVLLLDEPTVGVDPQSRERIFTMLEDLRTHGTSILLTTHHLNEAEQQCDRIVIIDRGRVVAEGTPLELIRRTIGVNRRVSFTLERPTPTVQQLGSMTDPRTLVAEVEDVAVELPRLLARIESAGGRVTDVAVAAPTLHAAFLHLTGRDLRE